MSDLPAPVRVAILLQDLENGGVERCFLNLARGFADRQVATDLYIGQVCDDRLLETAGDANLSRLQGFTPERRGEELAVRLEQHRPTVVLTGKEEDFRLMIEVRPGLQQPPKLVMVASLNYTGQLEGRQSRPWKKWMRYRELRRLFHQADQVFCVSEGVARDVAHILRRPSSELPALPNPVVTPEMKTLMQETLCHPWFEPEQPPVILGVGRLSRIKNFPLLLRAFAKARHEMPMRLMILGDGKQRTELLRLAGRLRIAEEVALPGFQANPYPYMRRADLLVLSSLWEGFGNVLVEALACGTPVVATDCPSGPRQILQDGRYGALVPINNEEALAAAMLACLRDPLSPVVLAEAVQPYTLENSASAYLTALHVVAS